MLKVKRYGFVFGALSLLLVSGVANASSCGYGTIYDLKEGGWNLDGLHIELLGSPINGGPATTADGDHPGTRRTGVDGHKFIYFDPSLLSPERMEAIRRIANIAFAMRAPVWVNSHTGNCLQATEISVMDKQLN